jgi:hypothetical protein
MTDHYGTIEGADAYHVARGNSAWEDAGEEEKTAALLKATAYLDGTYRRRFPGRRASGRAQPLEWPRVEATDVEGEEIDDASVPTEIEQAVYEAALIVLSDPEALTRRIDPREIRRIREEAGPFKEETEYFQSRTGIQAPLFSAVEDLLSGLLREAPGHVLAGQTERI